MSGSNSFDNVFGNSLLTWNRHMRLSKLLRSGGTRVLRELFDSIIPPETLVNTLSDPLCLHKLMEMKRGRIISRSEWKLLFPAPGSHVSSESWTIDLLFKLLRELFSLSPSATGWHSPPRSSVMSLSADLARLRFYRNTIPDLYYMIDNLTNEEYKRFWEEIKNTLLRIVRYYAPSSVEAWETAIDAFLVEPFPDGNQLGRRNQTKGMSRDLLGNIAMWLAVWALVVAETEAIATIPPEILARSPEALEAYKEALISGKTKNMRVLVTIVGPPRAGKTSLLNSLKGEDFDPTKDSTNGVVIQKAFCKPREKSWIEEHDSKDDSSKIRLVECMAQQLEYSNSMKDIPVTETTNTNYQAVVENQPSQPEKPEDAQQELGASGIDNTSLQQSIFHEISQLPEDIRDLLESHFRDAKKMCQRSNENKISLKTLDFAGQQVYEVILPLFMSSKSIYILVYSLENDLLSVAQSKVEHDNLERELENPFQMTHLDTQEFWLSCISSYTKKEVDSRTQVALPPVFVVCTHADVCQQDPKKVAQELCKIVTRPENPYGKHVVQNVYTVDNTTSGNKEVTDESAKRLKRDVEDLSQRLPQVDEDIPVSWLRFEEELSKLVEEEEKKYVDLEEATRIATKCKVNTASESIELTTLLNYLHDLKIIIYFEETKTVFIDTQWLVNMVVKVITVKPFEEWKEYADYWRKLEDEGILQRALVEHVWKDILSNGRNTVDSLLLIMEKFSLICPWRLNEEEVYLVPCMLSNSKGTDDIEMLLADQRSATMVIRFKSVHLPMGIFPRLFVALAEYSKKEWPEVSLPKLRPNFCRIFNVGEEGKLDICITSGIRTICVTVCNKYNIDGPSVTTFCQSVRELLVHIFDAMQNTCPRVENMELEYGICCPVCTKSKMKCSTHKTKGCKSDSCLHFVREEEIEHDRPECHEDDTNLDTLIREEAYSYWFPKANKCPHDQVEAHFLEANNHGGNGSSDNIPTRKRKHCFTDDIPRRKRKLKSKLSPSPSEKKLDELAQEIIPIWKRLGRKLGVGETKIEEIFRDNINYPEIREKAYQMLWFWKGSSRDPTYVTLGNALVELGMLDLARRYCDM